MSFPLYFFSASTRHSRVIRFDYSSFTAYHDPSCFVFPSQSSSIRSGHLLLDRNPQIFASTRPEICQYKNRVLACWAKVCSLCLHSSVEEMVTVNLGMLHCVLDHVYGAFMHRTMLSPPFFSRGWGGTKLDLLEKMIRQLFPDVAGQSWPPALVQPIWRTVWETRTACLREGVFKTPCDEQILGALPPECHIARVAFLVPKSVPPQNMACVVHLAGTTFLVFFFGQFSPPWNRCHNTCLLSSY